jgi:peptide/nickel transport system substrate-binding protein
MASAAETVVVAVGEKLQNYDPTNFQPRATFHVLANIFDMLVFRLPDTKIAPGLAASWSRDDATHWTFKLRPNVRFHDGSMFSAEDVKFTLDRISQPGLVDGKTSIRQNLLPDMDPVTVVDPLTVRINLKNSTPGEVLLSALSIMPIVSKAAMDKGTAAFQQRPIGTGPFKFDSGTLDGETVLSRFNDYWGGPEGVGTPGPTKLDKVVFKVIPELSTAISALQAGEVDIVKGLTPDLAQSLGREKSLQIKSYSGTRTTWLAMNTAAAPFDKKEVRQAMNHAINSDAIIKSIYRGEALRMTGAVPPFSAFYDTSLKAYAYDPAKAKQLLAAAGYPNGFSFVIDCIANFKDVANAMVQDLAKVGVTASVRLWEKSAMIAEVKKGSRQAVISDWGNAYRHPYDLIDPNLKSKGVNNLALFNNAKVDALLDEGSSAKDNETADKAYKQMQQIVYSEAPWVFGWVPNEIEAGSARLKGWVAGPDGYTFVSRISVD